MLAFAVPGGVEDLFQEMAAADASHSHDIAARHGVVIVSPEGAQVPSADSPALKDGVPRKLGDPKARVSPSP
jgi:hypothetical protein